MLVTTTINIKINVEISRFVIVIMSLNVCVNRKRYIVLQIFANRKMSTQIEIALSVLKSN